MELNIGKGDNQMIETMRDIAARLSKKHNFSEEILFIFLQKGVSDGLSLRGCEVTLRRTLSGRSGVPEFFSIEDLMEVTGMPREDLIAATKEMRLDAKLRGENPDDYAFKINQSNIVQ